MKKPFCFSVDRYGQNNFIFQKYSYNLSAELSEIMKIEKDPREIWVGISPGSLVNLHDKAVYVRSDEEIKHMLAN